MCFKVTALARVQTHLVDHSTYSFGGLEDLLQFLGRVFGV